jgi:hypothetical protein
MYRVVRRRSTRKRRGFIVLHRTPSILRRIPSSSLVKYMYLLCLLMAAKVVAETKAKWSSKEPWSETITTSTTRSKSITLSATRKCWALLLLLLLSLSQRTKLQNSLYYHYCSNIGCQFRFPSLELAEKLESGAKLGISNV